MRSNFHQNGPKIEIFWIFQGRKNRKTYFSLSDRLKDFIALLLSYHTHLYLNCALNAHGCAVIFTKNGPKIEVFWTFRGRKNRKIYFLLLDRLEDFIALLLRYHTHLYVNCGLGAQQVSTFAHFCAPAHQGDL